MIRLNKRNKNFAKVLIDLPFGLHFFYIYSSQFLVTRNFA